MTTILFYEKPGCVNNARQKNLLREAGHELVVRNLLETVWSPDELRAFFGGRPVPEWFNRAAPRIKSGEIVPETLDEARALALMLDDPLLIRRPLLQVGARREAGFDMERIQEWLGALESTESEEDLESCRRSQPCAAP
jgi:nitrogenase-associated protein